MHSDHHPTYHMVILITAMQEFESVNSQYIQGLSFFDIQKKFNGIQREDLFIGEESKWSNIVERIEEYQLLASLKSFDLKIHYYNSFSSILKSYNSEMDCIHFFDDCVNKEVIQKEWSVFSNMSSNMHWQEVTLNDLSIDKKHIKLFDTSFLLNGLTARLIA